MNDKALGTHATHPDRYVGLFVGAKIEHNSNIKEQINREMLYVKYY